MGEVVNLRQVRKAKRRVDDAERAQANRVKHGRRKADKQVAALDAKRLDAILDGARRDTDPH